MNAARRVPLLARRRPVRLQNPINERLHRSNVGFARARYGRTGGTASANACRTTRRWTPNFRDTPLIVPTPTLILPPNLCE